MTSTWTAPAVERASPPRAAPEREALEAWLDYHRQTLLWKCAGLTEQQLKTRSVPPSRLSLLGLVRHMTEVERSWFREHVTDTHMTMPYSSAENPDADFEDIDAADAAADLDAFRHEVEAARSAVQGRSLDDRVRAHGNDPREPADIRWIYLHMIEEYARHNGHADLIRERIDGATGD